MARVSRVQQGLLWLAAVSLPAGVPVHAEDDGPPPVNTTRSVSAGADDDIITSGDAPLRAEAAGSEHGPATYKGVVPGAGAPPPAAAAARKKAPLTITWPGFQMRPDGSSRVFIQSTAPLAPQPVAVTGKYRLLLPGARIAAQNNRLPLDTRYFNTPVTRVSLSADHKGATVSLDLRSDVTPQISSEAGAPGYYFTYIDLPKGSYVTAPPATPVPAPAASSGNNKHEVNGRIRLHD
jgi:hypothetical protein